MKISRLLVAVGCGLLVSGCLSSAPKPPVCWTVDQDHSVWPAVDLAQKTDDTARVSRVDVSAPYNSVRLAVLRPDGSVAFDAFNVFAVSPSALLTVAAKDAVRRYGPFARVLTPGSAARSRYSLEFNVGTLALDCRKEGECMALVELEVSLLEGREIVAVSTARAREAVTDDYSKAFSSAFFHAVADALSKLKGK